MLQPVALCVLAVVPVFWCLQRMEGHLPTIWPTGTSAKASDTITGICPGTNPYYITDAKGCTDTSYAYIYETPSIYVTAPSCDTCCDGSAISHSTGGSAPYTYQWTPEPKTGVWWGYSISACVVGILAVLQQQMGA